MKKILVFLFLILPLNIIYSQEGNFEKVKIDGENLTLNGILFPAEGIGSSPTLLLLQGFPGGESDVFGIGAKFQKAEINVLIFNYSGTYGSDGDYSMEYTTRDIQFAYNFLKEPNNVNKYQVDTSKIYLGGYSYGGGMALTYTANHPEIRKVFSIAGTDHGEFFREYFSNEQFAKMIDDMFEQLKAPEGPVRFEVGKMPKDITSEDVSKIDSTIDLRKCTPLIADRDILLIAGINDQYVTMENHMLPLYRALQNEGAENVEFVIVQDNHSFSKSREKVSDIILNWMKD